MSLVSSSRLALSLRTSPLVSSRQFFLPGILFSRFPPQSSLCRVHVPVLARLFATRTSSTKKDPAEIKYPKKKVAIILGYVGSKYQGVQR